MIFQPNVAFTAVAAPGTPVAEMIRASVFGAVHTDGDRGFAADAAGEGESWGQRVLLGLTAAGGCLLIIPRQRCASLSITLNSSSLVCASSATYRFNRSRLF